MVSLGYYLMHTHNAPSNNYLTQQQTIPAVENIMNLDMSHSANFIVHNQIKSDKYLGAGGVIIDNKLP